ncbi:MAG: type I glyceraldehyde-3-phosphate dehydrogenase [Candidatus Chisholmbacteria bacterium]|nr:type I glyceraldehyde-3-phosphate dehydrogenase [Candidatus Chisholmbacteria bacterium]
MVKLALNGFGRTARTAFRAYLLSHTQTAQVVAINTSGSMDTPGWAHLLKYDTAQGIFSQEVTFKDVQPASEASSADPLIGYLTISGHDYPLLAQPDPAQLPWKEYEVDVVIEATGAFRTPEAAAQHLQVGAKKVLLSTPPKGDSPQVETHILGVSDSSGSVDIISNASCTTNCVAPITAIIQAHFGILKAMMTTIHAYTDDQRLQDNSHKDLRRARAAALNIIPTTTGATTSTAQIIPEIDGKFAGLALRVPVVAGSLSDFVFLTKDNTTIEAVNQAFVAAARESRWQGILAVTDEPLVSSDIIGRPESAIIDLNFTNVVDGNLVKVLAWYDNEWGYSNRLIEQAIAIGKTVSP